MTADQDGLPDNPYYGAFKRPGGQDVIVKLPYMHGANRKTWSRTTAIPTTCRRDFLSYPCLITPDRLLKRRRLLSIHRRRHFPYEVGPGSPATLIIPGHRADKAISLKGMEWCSLAYGSKDAMSQRYYLDGRGTAAIVTTQHALASTRWYK